MKSNASKRIISMGGAVCAAEKTSGHIVVSSKRKPLNLPIKNILFVEVQGHKTIFHTTAGIVPTTLTLSDAEVLLDGDCFFKCHRSFIVNKWYIASAEKEDFLMENNERVPISRRFRVEAERRYMDWLLGRE